MYRRTDQNNNQPQPKDRNVGAEAKIQDEDQLSTLAMGNEWNNTHPLAARLNGSNESNEIDLSRGVGNLIDIGEEPENIINENHPPKKEKSAGDKADAEKTVKNASPQEVKQALKIIGDEQENPGKDGGAGDKAKADEDMEDVKGWNFTAVKHPERKNKVGGWRKFLTGAAWYTGKTFGKLLSLIGAIVTFPYTLYKYLDKNAAYDVNRALSRKKRHDLIPGWDGAKFSQPDPEKNDKINVDFRRVPMVWARMTADEALDKNGKERDPKLILNVNPPDLNKDQTMIKESAGHSGIGIEFSRYSKVTQRWERYLLEYGFYMGGSSSRSAGALGAYKNAVTPGQLMDEYGGSYKVTRKFNATNKQVNDVLRASETWADKGYNPYTRNCTTFAKEMLGDVAHLPISDQLFTDEEIRFSSKVNAQLMLASAGSGFFDMNVRGDLGDLADKEDLSYPSLGNKRATRDDFVNFEQSLKKGYSRTKSGYTPNAVAQNMIRAEGPGAGELSSMDYTGTMEKNTGGSLTYDLSDLRRVTIEEATKVKGKIDEITPPEMKDPANQPEKLRQLIEGLMDYGMPFRDLASKAKKIAKKKKLKEDAVLGVDYGLPEGDLRAARKTLSDNITNLNTLLSTYYKNDARLQPLIMDYISILNYGIKKIDVWYRNADRKNGDKRRMDMENQYLTVKAGGQDTLFSPTHYESYLQIYKTPAEAVKKYKKYKALLKRKENGEKLKAPDEKEFSRLERMDKLALQFDNAHNYLLEKDSFKQQDIDYAYALGEKERNNASGEMITQNHTAANTYQNLMLEKLFGGMKERIQGAIDSKQIKDYNNQDEIKDWLDKDVSECLSKKKTGTAMILRGIRRSLKNPDEDKICQAFKQTTLSSWFEKLFTSKDSNELKFVGLYVPSWFGVLMDDPGSKIRAVIDQLIEEELHPGHGLNEIIT